MRKTVIVGLMSLLAAGTAWSLPANLPLLTPDDISVTNNLGAWGNPGRITFEVKGETCEKIRIFLDVDETEKLSCPGAKYFIAYLHVTNKDGTQIDKETQLPTGAHYWYGWDKDSNFQSLTLIDVRLR